MFDVSPIRIHEFTLDESTGPHSANCFTLLVPREGRAEIKVDESQWIIQPGTALIVKENVAVSLTPLPYLAATVAWVHSEYLSDQLYWKHAPLIPDRLATCFVTNKLYVGPAQVLTLGRSLSARITSRLDEMRRLQERGDTERDLFLSQSHWFYLSYLLLPFVTVADAPELPAAPRVTFGYQGVQRVEISTAARLLTEEFAEAWTLERLAARVHMSPTHLRRLFVDAYGRTPGTFLIERRVEYLAYLMRETKLPVSKAILAAGWQKHTNANRHFERLTGHSLSDYRRLQRAA